MEQILLPSSAKSRILNYYRTNDEFPQLINGMFNTGTWNYYILKRKKNKESKHTTTKHKLPGAEVQAYNLSYSGE